MLVPLRTPPLTFPPTAAADRRRRGRTRTAVGYTAALSVAAAASVLPAVHVYAAGPSIGALRIVRQVEVTRDAVTGTVPPSYVAARDKEGVFAGEGVRTLKRSQAEIDFADKSVLRVNERTDLVVQNSDTLRNIQLHGGAVWVRVAKGVRTQVETPSATAVARGTLFVVSVLPNGGGTQLTVLEGVVDFVMPGGKTVSVHPGETISAPGPDSGQTAPDSPTMLSRSQLPVEYGGSVVGWWTTLGNNVGVVTTPGSDALFDLRSSPISEAVQEIMAASPAGPNPHDYFLPTAGERQTFFTNAGSSLRSDWQQYLANPSSYLSTYGSTPLTQVEGLSAEQVAALESLNVKTLGDAVQTYQANAANAGVTVSFDRNHAAAAATRTVITRPPLVRSEYRPDSLTGTPNYDYRLLDRNDTSLAFVGIGAAAALIADAGKLNGIAPPTFSAQAFGYGSDTSLTGERARLDGALGQTRYHMESNLLQLLSGGHNENFTRIDSVLYVEHPLGNDVSVFAGRRRFYEGPVFQNEVLSQLIADRYTSAGASYNAGAVSLTGAYLYDDNPDAAGSQHGALGSIGFHGGGGTYGIHYLHVSELTGGDGITGSLTYPIVRNVVDFYGEAGRAPDKATIQTYGAYFPSLFQRADTDLFLEYGSHDGLGRSFSIIGAHDIGNNFNVRAFVSFLNDAEGHSGNQTKAGLAGVFRFSTH